KLPILLDVEIVNGCEVGMIELRENQSFLVEMPAGRVVGERVVWEDFDGNITGKMFVAGAVHFSHAASADLLDDAVVAQSLANSLILVHRIVRRGENILSPRPLRQIVG